MHVNNAHVSSGLGRAERMIAAVAVLILTAVATPAQGSPRHAELPNFHKVNERLFRGGQPKSSGIKKLAEMGTKTIINLRGTDRRTRADEAEAKAAGIFYFNIPLPVLSRPSHEQVSRIMAILESEENWPVFVHCKRGSDRTGTVIALYRITHDEWTANQAMFEAKNFGLSWVQFGMKDYISDYFRDRKGGRMKPAEQITELPE